MDEDEEEEDDDNEDEEEGNDENDKEAVVGSLVGHTCRRCTVSAELMQALKTRKRSSSGDRLEQDKCLLAMVQPTRELSSFVHNLEARAEADDAIAQGIRKSVIIFEVDADTEDEDGRRVCLRYSLMLFPATVVIEPSTGIHMCLMAGRVGEDALLNILTSFSAPN
ncbi:hypothetical protein RHMOL_Rhmol03G0191800 [Rhododendron molle]|uniref:Uncharacterized protein n=1 Tax=Rhododendron molle TaxID=49168 RepID=A0ACC0PHR8_RHOML|nr:hypothetical protein RHMOL_Rhmol03G0191800 [Rhododendron molle]